MGPILSETNCKFLFPVSFPDVLLVGARAQSVGEDSFVLEVSFFFFLTEVNLSGPYWHSVPFTLHSAHSTMRGPYATSEWSAVALGPWLQLITPQVECDLLCEYVGTSFFFAQFSGRAMGRARRWAALPAAG